MKFDEFKKLLETAKNIATKAHEGQYRFDGKTPYITHPEAVANMFEVEEPKDLGVIDIFPMLGIDKEYMEAGIVSWLHDVVEDTDVSLGDLLNQGIPFYLVNVIEILTHRESEKYLDYILRVKENNLATSVKKVDIEHNLCCSTSKSQRIKYELALYVLGL